MSRSKIVLTGDTLTIDEVVNVARYNQPVKLGSQAKKRVETAARLVSEWVESGEVIYGVTTGFGPFSEIIIPPEKSSELQWSLIISHATGVGNPLPTEVVRAAILLRANTLAKGYSGIQPQTLDLLIALLNEGVHPIIPEKGSVGASGDLAPLAHLVLVLIGEGHAEYRGEIFSGAEALRHAGLKPIELAQKEGIALINGTQIMTAIAALAVVDAKNLVASAEIAAAMSIEALEGVFDAYDPRIHLVRPHPGQQHSAANLAALLNNSGQVLTSQTRAQYAKKAAADFHDAFAHVSDYDTIRSILHQVIQSVITLDYQILVEPHKSAKSLKIKREQIQKHFETLGVSADAFEAALKVAQNTRRVQDAYSLRCTPQVIGAARDVIEYARRIVSIEINSATDNPLIFPSDKTFLSGGNFHGQPIAVAMDCLSIAITSVGSIAERRIARLIDNKLSNGLPLLLVHPALSNYGVYYGLGLAHITAASLAAESQKLCTPASVRSIPTSANQEDHVSMGTIAARHSREILNNVENIIAIELLCASQGLDIRQLRKPVKMGNGTKIAHKLVRQIVPRKIEANSVPRDRLTQDVLVHQEINKLWLLVHEGRLAKQVGKSTKGFTAEFSA